MKHFDQYSDLEVIRKILGGEMAMFEIMIRRYNAALYKAGRAYNFNHEDTQDLMQDSFIDAYLNLSKYENRSSFKTWLLRIMLNNCFRKKQRFSFKNEIQGDISDKSIPMFSSNRNTDTAKIVLTKEL